MTIKTLLYTFPNRINLRFARVHWINVYERGREKKNTHTAKTKNVTFWYTYKKIFIPICCVLLFMRSDYECTFDLFIFISPAEVDPLRRMNGFGHFLPIANCLIGVVLLYCLLLRLWAQRQKLKTVVVVVYTYVIGILLYDFSEIQCKCTFYVYYLLVNILWEHAKPSTVWYCWRLRFTQYITDYIHGNLTEIAWFILCEYEGRFILSIKTTEHPFLRRITFGLCLFSRFASIAMMCGGFQQRHMDTTLKR